MRKAFKGIDDNGDGEITKEELKKIIKHEVQDQMTDEMIDDLIRQSDLNGDGKIQFEEFCRMQFLKAGKAEDDQDSPEPKVTPDFKDNSEKTKGLEDVKLSRAFTLQHIMEQVVAE